MTMSGGSFRTRAKVDPYPPKGMNETFLGYYVGEGDPRYLYVSPLFGDLSGLPPLMVQVGDNEMLRDDSMMFAEKAKSAGVPVQMKVWQGMFHCFPLPAPLFAEATEAMNEVAAFIHQQIQWNN